MCRGCRARNLNFRTLEVFRGLGLEKEIHAAGDHVTHSYLKEMLASPEQKELPGLNVEALIPPNQQETSPEPFVMYCPQSRLEPVLRAANRQLGVVRRIVIQEMFYRLPENLGCVINL